MSNQGNFSRNKEKRPMDADAAQHRWYGYNDFAAGLGFRREYETFTPWNQRNYEVGRQYAAFAKGVSGAVPKWGRNKKLSAVLQARLGGAARAHALETNKLFRPRPQAAAVEA